MRSLLSGLGLLCAAGLCSCSHRPAPPPAATAPPLAAPPQKGRSAEEIKAGFERSKQRTPHLPLMSDEAAHAAMPTMYKGRPMPNLMRVAGLQPRTMEAVLAVAKSARTEGELEPRLLNDVFWAVSSANECFY
jgi:hypothetical protein